MLLAIAHVLVAGLVVGPCALRPPQPRHLVMCSAEQTTPEANVRSPSLLTEVSKMMREAGGAMRAQTTFKEEMQEAFGALAGDANSAEIDLDQFQMLFAQMGDALPAGEAAEMFAQVDTNGDGKIEYVKYYQALMNKVREVNKAKGPI